MTPSSSAALWILSGVSAGVSSFGAVSRTSRRFRIATRILALGSLAALAWFSGQGWLLALALTLITTGELFVAFQSQRWLTPGLLAFLLARAALIAVFARTGGGVLMFRSEPMRLAGVVVAISATVLTLRFLWLRLGPMRGPATVYAIAATALTVSALTLPWARWPAIVGTFSLFASDALLSMTLFGGKTERRWSPTWGIWWLYFAGQALILWTFIPTITR